MKLKYFVLFTVIACSERCMVKTASASECQVICDHSTSCDVWEFDVAKNCRMKTRTGWTPDDRVGHFVGFKHQNVVIPDTQLHGGDYYCGPQT